MHFFSNMLQISGLTLIMLLGTAGMLVLCLTVIYFFVMHNKKITGYHQHLLDMENIHQKQLLSASIKMQEEERKRLAADLHDDAGPLLATVRLYLNENLVNQDKSSQLQSIIQARQIIDDTIMLIRNISHDLMPPTLKNFGLESAVNDLISKISGSGSVNASSRFHDYRERLKPEKELVVFRIMQELINNILRHSGASFIHVTQNVMNNRFYIRVHHDGQGLEQDAFEKLSKTNTGLGLKNIKSRVNLLQGTISFEKDISKTYYKMTLEIPKDDPWKD
jgi:two-component system NarL family sensor kinase